MRSFASVSVIAAVVLVANSLSTSVCLAFQSSLSLLTVNTRQHGSSNKVLCNAKSDDVHKKESSIMSRRGWGESLFQTVAVVVSSSTAAACCCFAPSSAQASDFTPGGTLVERKVGVQVGNPGASPSRKPDNGNVLFYQDYYFKFGTAAPWLEPDSTEFPKTMPFTRIQQRYDAMQKYQRRISDGLARIQQVVVLASESPETIADPAAADVYALRPMGLLANSMLASENSGATNELFLARWYINELYLLIGDMRTAPSPEQAQAIAPAVRKAANSYLTMMNRVIASKVGNKFEYL